MSDETRILAIDPGEHHVGLAWGQSDPDAKYGWTVSDTAEMTPAQFRPWFWKNIGTEWDWITCEKFTLYASLAKEQIGSEMPTSKLIGFIEGVIEMHNALVEEQNQPGMTRTGLRGITYESNAASIQKPTTALLRKLKIRPVSPATPDHQRSAELHLYYTLLRNGVVPGVTLS